MSTMPKRLRHDPAMPGTLRQPLRPGNVHSADGWKDVLDPVVAR